VTERCRLFKTRRKLVLVTRRQVAPVPKRQTRKVIDPALAIVPVHQLLPLLIDTLASPMAPTLCPSAEAGRSCEASSMRSVERLPTDQSSTSCRTWSRFVGPRRDAGAARLRPVISAIRSLNSRQNRVPSSSWAISLSN
jgi:hypothetical protein